MPNMLMQPVRNTDTTASAPHLAAHQARKASLSRGHCFNWTTSETASTCTICDEKSEGGAKHSSWWHDARGVQENTKPKTTFSPLPSEHIPNVTVRPFAITKEYLEGVRRLTISPEIGTALASWGKYQGGVADLVAILGAASKVQSLQDTGRYRDMGRNEDNKRYTFENNRTVGKLKKRKAVYLPTWWRCCLRFSDTPSP